MKTHGSQREERQGQKPGQPQPQQWPGKPANPGQQWPSKQPDAKPAPTWPSQPSQPSR